jgi:hypothetical protein
MLLAAYNVFHLHASDSTMVDNTISAYYSNKISVIQTEFQPFLDGLSIDECWQKAKKFTFCSDNTDQKIYLQICRNEKMLFLKIEYSIDDYRDSYQNWHWNPVIQAYEPGSEFEETLSIALQDENSQISDIWCWRAARTNPAGKTDDMFFNKNGKLKFDSGTLCWYSRFFGNYVGEALPRFYIQSPSGSVCDVNASGVYNGKTLTIEFSRNLFTGNNDDIQLNPAHSYRIAIIRGRISQKTIQEIHFTKIEFQ